jgi:transcriptional antiterminator NusG
MSKWYVIRVIPGKERQLNEHFNTQISLGKMSFIDRFVCPMEKEFVVIRKKKALRERVIYNGYLYFESQNQLTEDQLKTVAAFPAVMGMLGDKRPRRMSEDDINKILKDEVLEKHKESKSIRFMIGENVIINEGPFTSFNGVVSNIYNDKVQLNVKVFGRDTMVEVNIEQIAKI